MISILYEVIALKKFSQNYYNNIPDDDKSLISIPQDITQWKLITEDNIIKGSIGIIKHKFIQIYIEPKYRGQNIYKQALDDLMFELNLDTVYASILKTNIPSIKSHIKIGFIEDKLYAKELENKGLFNTTVKILLKYTK